MYFYVQMSNNCRDRKTINFVRGVGFPLPFFSFLFLPEFAYFAIWFTAVFIYWFYLFYFKLGKNLCGFNKKRHLKGSHVNCETITHKTIRVTVDYLDYVDAFICGMV